MDLKTIWSFSNFPLTLVRIKLLGEKKPFPDTKLFFANGVKSMSFFFPETDSEETINNWRLKSEWQRPQAFLFTHLFSEKCKITCVVWQDDTSVAAATDDGTAKLFKLQNGTLKVLQSHTTHRELSRDKFRINAIAVTKDFKVITGDDYGNLVIWDTFAKQTRCLTLSKNTILVMKAHPEHPGVLAFGCRLGLVYVVNLIGNVQLFSN